MKFITALVLALVAFCAPSQAQFDGCPFGFCQQVTRASFHYQGPGDTVSGAYAWWGLRCYSNAYSGLVADVTDSSTGNTTGTRLQCSSGTVSSLVSSTACTFVTAGTPNLCSPLATTCMTACNILTLYDQSGNTNCLASPVPCDMTQSVNANRPALIVSCQNSRPCAVFTSSATLISAVGSATRPSQPFSISWAAKKTGGGVTQDAFSNSGNLQTGFGIGAANQIYIYAAGGLPSVGATDGSFYAVNTIWNNASSDININGTSNPVNLGSSNGLSTSPFSINTSQNSLTGQWLEAGVWATAFTGPQESLMAANQRHPTYGWNF